MLRSWGWMRSGQPPLPRTEAPAELLRAKPAGETLCWGSPEWLSCLSWKPESCTSSCQPASQANGAWGFWGQVRCHEAALLQGADSVQAALAMRPAHPSLPPPIFSASLLQEHTLTHLP